MTNSTTWMPAIRNTIVISGGVWCLLMTALMPILQISELMDCNLTTDNILPAMTMLISVGIGLIIYGIVCVLKDGVDNE